MRCLSNLSRYSIQVFEGREEVVVDARGYASTHPLKKPVIANFAVSGLLDHEIEAALESFSFSGLPDGVSPLARIAVFDTEVFCQQYDEKTRDDMQAQIDQRLRDLQKQFPSEFIIVDQPAALKPWPKYDEGDVEEVLRVQAVIGVDPQVVRLYEEENQNREEIVQAMLKLEAPDVYGEPEAHVDEVVEGPKEAFTVGT